MLNSKIYLLLTKTFIFFACVLSLIGCNFEVSQNDEIRDRNLPSINGSNDLENIASVLSTTVITPRIQRVAFILYSRNSLIQAPELKVNSYYLGQGIAKKDFFEESYAQFYKWPYGTKGNYTTELNFDRVGNWELHAELLGDIQGPNRARIPLSVIKESPVVDVGEKAPDSISTTLKEVANVSYLTSSANPDPELYLHSLNSIIGNGTPLVISFASPGYCTSPSCGPQIETLSELKSAHRDKSFFLHIEYYENLDQIKKNFEARRVKSIVHQWGISNVKGWKNESWTFVLNGAGIVTARFEGYVSAVELEKALLKLLK